MCSPYASQYHAIEACRGVRRSPQGLNTTDGRRETSFTPPTAERNPQQAPGPREKTRGKASQSWGARQPSRTAGQSASGYTGFLFASSGKTARSSLPELHAGASHVAAVTGCPSVLHFSAAESTREPTYLCLHAGSARVRMHACRCHAAGIGCTVIIRSRSRTNVSTSNIFVCKSLKLS